MLKTRLTGRDCVFPHTLAMSIEDLLASVALEKTRFTLMGKSVYPYDFLFFSPLHRDVHNVVQVVASVIPHPSQTFHVCCLARLTLGTKDFPDPLTANNKGCPRSTDLPPLEVVVSTIFQGESIKSKRSHDQDGFTEKIIGMAKEFGSVSVAYISLSIVLMF